MVLSIRVSLFIHKGGIYLIYSDRYNEVNYAVEPTPIGCSKDFFVSLDYPSIRTDISLKYTYDVQIWGQLKSQNGLPLSGIHVRLLQLNPLSHSITCVEIDKAITDYNGFYLFTLINQPAAYYQIIIYSSNSLYNKIISPPINSCNIPHQYLPIYQRAILDYLDLHFPSVFGYEHFICYDLTPSVVTTIYAIPSYR